MTRDGKRAQATLSLVLLIGGIVIEIAVAGAFLASLISTSGRGERLSERARAVARAGIEDVALNIARNKEFAGATGGTYSLSLESDRADITVTRARQGENYIYTILAIGDAQGTKRKLSLQVVVDTRTGIIRSQSLTEIPLSP